MYTFGYSPKVANVRSIRETLYEPTRYRRIPMNLPPFVYSLAFWKALTFVVATVWIFFNPDSLITAVTLLTAVQAVLQLLGINIELRARGLK